MKRAAFALFLACSAGHIEPQRVVPDAAPPAPVGQPPGWDDQVRLTPATNISQVKKIVQVRLEAAPVDLEIVPGTKTRVWAYNGSVPGPLIRAHAGDRLIVTFVNNLPEESTVHWHGIRLPPEMDGVPGHSQAPVPPGGEFRYDFVVPDPGLYWYHPHVQSAKQVGDGLYGALLVEDPAEPAGLGDEVVMVLSDMSLTDDGQLAAPDAGGGIASLFGREGERLLVNGHLNPTLMARPGRRQRWRLVNAARSRYFQLAIEGHGFTRLGGGGGFIEQPQTVERVMITPGQRADVVVTPQGAAGDTLKVRWVAYDRGYGSTYMRPDVDMFSVRLAGAAARPEPPLPTHLRTIAPLDTTGATVQELHLTSDVVDGNLVMGINGKPSGSAPPLYAHLGETQVWNVTNDIAFAHPFHIHGFFFQVLETSDAAGPLPAGPVEWRDTADVPAKGKMRLAVRFDDRPGMWMFHCHILDHADAGMMGEVMLQP